MSLTHIINRLQLRHIPAAAVAARSLATKVPVNTANSAETPVVATPAVAATAPPPAASAVPFAGDMRKPVVPRDYRLMYPEFLPDPKIEWRNPVKEKLERLDMLQRR